MLLFTLKSKATISCADFIALMRSCKAQYLMKSAWLKLLSNQMKRSGPFQMMLKQFLAVIQEEVSVQMDSRRIMLRIVEIIRFRFQQKHYNSLTITKQFQSVRSKARICHLSVRVLFAIRVITGSQLERFMVFGTI